MSVVKKQHDSAVGRLVGGPVGFRRGLERLGPTFIKIGQFLALRPDLIPQQYCDELMHLLDAVPPFPWSAAEAILTEDLGDDLTQIFSHLDSRPIAAGSLAQTHYARLLDGTEVAVKILRPDIRKQVLRDLKRARRLARLLELSGTNFILSPRELVEELTAWMLQEIDLRHELSNINRLHRLTARSEHEKVPKPYPRLCSPRVLTVEYLHGIAVSELLRAVSAGRADELARLADLRIDLDEFARNLITSSLTQIFSYQFFHADLHPGNLIALPDNIIGFVDFGLCDALDETVRKGQMRYLAAVYGNNVEQIFEAITEVLIPGERTDMARFRADVLAATQTWFESSTEREQLPAAARAESARSPIAQWMVSVMQAARRHGLQVPARLLAMYRALLTAEAVARELRTNVDLWEVGREFFREQQLEEAIRSLESERLGSVALDTLTLLRESPGQLQQILSGLAEGRFTLKVEVVESARVVQARARRVRVLVTALLAVGVAVLLTAPALPTVSGVSVSWLLLAALLLLYVWTLAQWRRLK